MGVLLYRAILVLGTSSSVLLSIFGSMLYNGSNLIEMSGDNKQQAGVSCYVAAVLYLFVVGGALLGRDFLIGGDKEDNGLYRARARRLTESADRQLQEPLLSTGLEKHPEQTERK